MPKYAWAAHAKSSSCICCRSYQRQALNAKPVFEMQVVPFSPASGLLEWVEDTIPVHEYLTGKDKHTGAHKRYKKPADISFAQCFQAMHKAKRNQLRHTFDHVCTLPCPAVPCSDLPWPSLPCPAIDSVLCTCFVGLFDCC